MSTTRHGGATHIGLQRKINEDAILALDGHQIWLVADGMGGHAAGDFASQTIVEAVAALPVGIAPAERMHALRAALHAAHAAIRAESLRRDGATVGAAVVALILTNAHFVAFWAGDSRLYRMRDGEIAMLTTDHSVVAELVLAGQMSWDEAEHHPHSNAITRAVGVGEELELDKIRGDVQPGDRFLLCSDGLSRYAPFETLRRVLDGAPIETLPGTLIGLALEGGGADNVSVIVIDAL